MSQDPRVAGAGMIPFSKPGASPPYHQMSAEAVRLALADAGVGYATDRGHPSQRINGSGSGLSTDRGQACNT